MIKLLLVITAGVIMNSAVEIKDFSSTETSGEWRIVNDGVMGGLSQSTFTINSDGTATFKGNVTPENNGGFASVRTMIDMDDKMDFEGALVRVKGDGNIYSLRFRTNRSFDGISYQAKFRTEKDTWKEFMIPFSEFTPVWRGQRVSGQPELTSEDIEQMGFLIADKQFGDFEMKIDWIKFY